MKDTSIGELKSMQVVNICNGEVLGTPDDFNIRIDGCSAQLTSIIINNSGFFNFGKKNTICIPWKAVECIGEDAILVNIAPERFSCGKKSSNL